MGKLVLYYATMNAGKSIDLIRTAYNYEENGFKILVMKPSIDTKAGSAIQTRVGLERNVDILIKSDDDIYELLKGKLSDITCIFIDEAQFLTKKQVESFAEISESLDISIICYALRTNFRQELFEGSAALFTYAENMSELKTLCKCGTTARFVGRKVNGKYTLDGDEVVIDGSSDEVEYVPLCGKCYLRDVKKIDPETIKVKMLKK